MHIENEVKLDFKDVLIRPQRSTLTSRKEVDITRTFKFPHSGRTWTGVPIVAANMDTVGTMAMHDALATHQMMTAFHKHHEVDVLVDKFTNFYLEFTTSKSLISSDSDKIRESSENMNVMAFYSLGISDEDLGKLATVYARVQERTQCSVEDHPIQFLCVDVANGYTEKFLETIRVLRKTYPRVTIMAGNVVTGDMTQALILAGADIVKVGIGPGSVCTTRKMTGVGYPQLSAIIECAEAAHHLNGMICGDGGCTVPGDLSKAFGAGADFVMLGGMLAGHDQSGGELITTYDENGNITSQVKRFYGMSSDTAMNKHNGGVASYRASEGKTVDVKYRGDVAGTIQGVLGGIRSACTYVGASRLKELTKRTTFVRVTQQINEVFGKAE